MNIFGGDFKRIETLNSPRVFVIVIKMLLLKIDDKG